MTTIEDATKALEGHPDFRLIRRMDEVRFYHEDDGATKFLGVATDTETTGLEDDARIIELAAVVFEFGSDGRIFDVVLRTSWLEDPGEPLSPEVSRITGLTDDMLRGKRIDDAYGASILAKADLIIAHNAAFDRPKIDARLPGIGANWACSSTEIDWAAEGIESTKLEYIAYRLGFFYEGHRALTDANALVHALAQPLPISGRPALASLLDRVRSPSYRVWALGAPFAVKDELKARGYRWSGGEHGSTKGWYRDVDSASHIGETDWLIKEFGIRPVSTKFTAKSRFTKDALRLVTK